MRAPSGLTPAEESQSPWPRSTARSFPSAPKTRAVRSSEAVTTVDPSGPKTAARTSASCPRSTTGAPVPSAESTRAVLSDDARTSRSPRGLSATPVIRASCRGTTTGVPWPSRRATRAVWSAEATAIVAPSGLMNAAWRGPAPCRPSAAPRSAVLHTRATESDPAVSRYLPSGLKRAETTVPSWPRSTSEGTAGGAGTAAPAVGSGGGRGPPPGSGGRGGPALGTGGKGGSGGAAGPAVVTAGAPGVTAGQKRTVPSDEAVARYLPSGANATDVTGPA